MGAATTTATAAAAALSVKEFATRPFVQRAVAQPMKVESVLTFFFGIDFGSQDHVIAMRQGVPFQDMNSLWYGGGPEYDKLCQAFRDTVRAAGKNEFPSSTFFNENKKESTLLLTQVDGIAARMILCDQLSRNIFRGTTEAFSYEEPALKACRQLTDVVLPAATSMEGNKDRFSGEVYPPYLSFMVTALMHSEAKNDHNHAEELLQIAKEKYSYLNDTWSLQLPFLRDHTAVIDRFGRYPHRNKAKGRGNTPAEETWLADEANLPGWAKSQM